MEETPYEVTEYDSALPQLADDSLIRIAREAEARINAVNQIKQIALKVTNARDWTDQNGNPYLQVSGSEKVAGVFNVSWRIGEPVYDEEPDGNFTFTYNGRFSIPGREIEVTGSRSSKDPFFKKYEWANGVKTEKPISAIDKRDVKMAAMTNLLGNGITRLLGIRNMTWEDLEKYAGIKKDAVGKVEYKKKGADKPPVSQPQRKTKEKEAEETKTETVTAIPEDIEEKSGEKDGKPWTMYIINAGGEKYRTFDQAAATVAMDQAKAGLECVIEFRPGKFGKELVSIEPVAF